MAVLTSVEEYKAAHAESSAEARKAKAELERLQKQFKRIADAEEKAAAAEARAADLAEKNKVLQADVARLTNDLDAAQKARQVAAGDAEKLKAIKLALA